MTALLATRGMAPGTGAAGAPVGEAGVLEVGTDAFGAPARPGAPDSIAAGTAVEPPIGPPGPTAVATARPVRCPVPPRIPRSVAPANPPVGTTAGSAPVGTVPGIPA